MIKSLLIFSLLVLLFSCSSTGQKEYKKNEVEGRADEHSAMGDKYRNERKYDDAFSYYQIASDLYLLKGNRDKYVLTKLKQCLLLLKGNKYDEFSALINKLKTFNEMEGLGLNRQISYLEARQFYQRDEKLKGNSIIKKLIAKYKSSDEFEQKVYYEFYYISENIGEVSQNVLDRSKDSVDELKELYDSGKLENVEVLTFSMRILSQLYLANRKFIQAKLTIKQTDKLYLDLELTSKRDQILELYIKLYEGLKDASKTEYYKGLLDHFRPLIKKYN